MVNSFTEIPSSVDPDAVPPSPRLRRALRDLRRALTPARQRRHARALARLLGRDLSVRRARRIALYWPADGELDPRPLLKRLDRADRQWFLPVLPVPRRGAQARRLWFARWDPGERMRPNRFGIPEPWGRGQAIRLAGQLDVLLVPLVGFDAEGHRIGMGGGFYDRTLAGRRQRCCWRRPRLIGIAHECQRLERINPRPWDIRLDAVVTERRSYTPLSAGRAPSPG